MRSPNKNEVKTLIFGVAAGLAGGVAVEGLPPDVVRANDSANSTHSDKSTGVAESRQEAGAIFRHEPAAVVVHNLQDNGGVGPKPPADNTKNSDNLDDKFNQLNNDSQTNDTESVPKWKVEEKALVDYMDLLQKDKSLLVEPIEKQNFVDSASDKGKHEKMASFKAFKAPDEDDKLDSDSGKYCFLFFDPESSTFELNISSDAGPTVNAISGLSGDQLAPVIKGVLSLSERQKSEMLKDKYTAEAIHNRYMQELFNLLQATSPNAQVEISGYGL